MKQLGFYWVKYQNSWTVAEKTTEVDASNYWYVVGSGSPLYESEFEQIGDRILTPQEIDAIEPYKGHIIAGKKDNNSGK